MKYCIGLLLLLIVPLKYFTQTNENDSIFLMNGRITCGTVDDTSKTISAILSENQGGRKVNYDFDQIFMIRYASGRKVYFYSQDTLNGNWLSREDMWLYMAGEQDARKGFKATGAFYGAGVAGLAGGLTGTFWGPIAPYGFMALSGIPKVKIRHETVRDLNLLKSDAYLMGYVRVAKQRIKLRSLVGGTIGLIAGYGIYGLVKLSEQ